MPLSEKTLQTIIDKWGSYEAYKAWRYSPEKTKHLKEAQSLGGKNSTNRPYKDPVKAKEAGAKGLEKRWGDERT